VLETRVPKQCRRCSSGISEATVIGTRCRQCQRCGYVTCGPRDDLRLPLATLETYGVNLPQLVDEPSHDGTLRMIANVRRILVDELCHVVSVNHRGVQEWLLKLLIASKNLGQSLEEQPSRAGSIPYRAIQIAYAALLSAGYMLDLSPKPSAEERNACKDLYAFAGDIVALSNIITLGRRGLRSLRLTGGTVSASTTETDDALFELAQNIAFEKGLDTPDTLSIVLDNYASEAERTMFGWKLADLLQIPYKEWALNTEDGLIILDLSRAPDSNRNFVDMFALTADRLHQFGAPYFLDLSTFALLR
jgi:hypothetical protein